MSKKLLRTMSEELNDDIVIEMESIRHKEVYLILPDLKISGDGSIKSLAIRAYSTQVNDSMLLHKLFGKMRE